MPVRLSRVRFIDIFIFVVSQKIKIKVKLSLSLIKHNTMKTS